MITVKHLLEMAKRIDQPHTGNLTFKEKRRYLYRDFKLHQKISENGVFSVHKHVKGNITRYSTLDNDKGEVVHTSLFSHKMQSDNFPFEHHEQIDVERTDGVLPKGYVTDFVYNHFKDSNIPLKSSETQYPDGHKMWGRLVDRALEDGHNVYHWDGGKLHQTTQDNKEKQLENSFGFHNDFMNKHMILSKVKL